MFPESKVTDIYCIADDSCKEFALQQGKYMVEDKEHKHCNKSNRMNDTKIIVILILFYSDGFRCFKHYYKEYVCKHLTHLFPDRVSYNRLVELEKEVQLPLVVFIKKVLLETCTGISFVDSTPLACLPQPTDTGLQDLRRTCRARKMFHGMVFRVQTSSDY